LQLTRTATLQRLLQVTALLLFLALLQLNTWLLQVAEVEVQVELALVMVGMVEEEPVDLELLAVVIAAQ